MRNKSKTAAEAPVDIGSLVLPSLWNVAAERVGIKLKQLQAGVWDLARDTYTRGLEQRVYAGWVFRGSDGDWASSADSYRLDRYLRPSSVGLMYVGYTGQPDYLKDSVPEILAVVVPVTLRDGELTAVTEKIVVRSVSCAARGDNGRHSAERLDQYSRQFNYSHETTFMHTAYCAATQYLMALRGSANFVTATAASRFPLPTLNQLVRRGKPNRDGVPPAPTPVPLNQVEHDDDAALWSRGADVENNIVLDVEAMGDGVDVGSGVMRAVPQTSPWRVLTGHVRGVHHRYGDDDLSTKIAQPVTNVWYSVR